MWPEPIDISVVRGQAVAKRGMEIAAAGGHDLILVGRGGCGKTLLTHAFAGILPSPTIEQLDRASAIHRAAGRIATGERLELRPVVRPPPASTRQSMVGVKGQILLADQGLLVLDDAERFAPEVLAAVRDVIEWGEVRPASGRSHAVSFQMLATLRRCPCGMAADFSSPCGAGPTCQAHHQWRAIKWFIDVADLQVMMEPTHGSDWITRSVEEPTMMVRSRVEQAYRRQLDRGQLNAQLSGKAFETVCFLDRDCQTLLDYAMEAQRLSARDYVSTLKVARTLADLEGVDAIRRVHVAEALIYRFLRVRYGLHSRAGKQPPQIGLARTRRK